MFNNLSIGETMNGCLIAITIEMLTYNLKEVVASTRCKAMAWCKKKIVTISYSYIK